MQLFNDMADGITDDVQRAYDDFLAAKRKWNSRTETNVAHATRQLEVEALELANADDRGVAYELRSTMNSERDRASKVAAKVKYLLGRDLSSARKAKVLLERLTTELPELGVRGQTTKDKVSKLISEEQTAYD